MHPSGASKNILILNSMKVKLMITGGLGYIGSFTAKKFLDQNKLKPIVVDNLQFD